MRYILLPLALFSLSFASIENISTFKADFVQSVTDEKNKVLHYNGNVIALKPQNALWKYSKPVTKDVYMNPQTIVIIEPEIEQVIIRKVESNFDFFNMISHAKKIGENRYETSFQNTKFNIRTKNEMVESISYKDEFENQIEIVFKNQIQNESIEKDLFVPKIPKDFDVIKD
ncbi:MAG: outer membrane lipoprotein chaperone LolA [Sulfurimonas sp.]|jgi:outer membrane lipoprotein carrier protein|nr:outer membrane lipoprotein chaperone LolA [Sulfurimonas sp.]MBU1216196.1 LolA-like outer membrane lipoprotein chaperone [bacterium]MBU1434502.1 LolA-like outer membrane lipoprotein chaperone [bacterium]MBU1502080.1 LolA-like outer membrane lipoprotein chaperone [bacterium]MBU3937914.1 LolA-like outer membrane lipoprotein chaperone [bacterium]